MLQTSKITILTLSFLGFLCVNSTKLPSYMKQCSLSDPNVNKCLVKHANLAIPYLIHGDKKLKVPDLIPLLVDDVTLNPSNDLTFKLRNLKIYGLEGATVQKAEFFKDGLKLNFKVHVPRVEIESDYNIKGRILVIPLEGEGPSNITIVNGIYDYTVELELFDKKGTQYAGVKDSKMVYTAERAHFRFENLFNGNKQLSDHVHNFLNENNREVGQELGPSVAETISVIITSIVKAVLRHVPWNEVVLP